MDILKTFNLDKETIIKEAKKGISDFLRNYRINNKLENPVWLRLYSVPTKENDIIDMLGIEADLVTVEGQVKDFYKIRNLEKFDFDNIDSKIKGTLNLVLSGAKNPLLNMLVSDMPEIENIKALIPEVAEKIKAEIPNDKINVLFSRNGEIHFARFNKKGEFIGTLDFTKILTLEI
jgi:hypothetical protein